MAVRLAFDGPSSLDGVIPMSRYPLALTLLLASLSALACEQPPSAAGRPDARPPALPAPLYHASKLGQDPQATAQALFKNIPPAEADKRYEVVVSVRELPPQPIRLQPTTAPLKGQ